MSLNSNKRRNKANINHKFSQNRVAERIMASDGVYSNSRFMHSAASLVGCIVQIQVRNGSYYEGIFRTFSNQLDLVLEMPHKVDQKVVPAKGIGPAVSNLLVSFPFEDKIADKLVFKLKDIVVLKASNVDLDYAIKDNFTDTAISKFNGQVTERKLEPWEGPSCTEMDSLGELDTCEEDGTVSSTNGWDANDMFRLNAERYGVKSTYDNTLHEYTVPLTKKNTDEYRQQEAKAIKIAQEIESTASYLSHIQLENGDEEDRFSAVMRPENANPNRYLPPQRRKNVQGPKRPLTLPTLLPNAGQRPYPPVSFNSCSQSFKSPPSTSKQSPSPPMPGQLPPNIAMPLPKDKVERTLNGEEIEKDEVVASAVISDHMPQIHTGIKIAAQNIPQPLPPRPERWADRKATKHKGRDDEIEEFKKFSSSFKLSDESKESKDEREDYPASIETKDDSPLSKISDMTLGDKCEVDQEKVNNILKASKLNPMAKEFVMSPKVFTPRSLAVSSPPTAVPIQSQRMHSQSPVMAMQHGPVMHGMGQPVFATMAPQYIMQATPVSMALSAPFASTLSQAQRIRKVPMMQPRHDISQSMHVAAATGQPILAPNPIPNPSQLTMQYTPSPGIIHAPGPPQQTMGYPQMSYVVGPRGMSQQPVGMVPTSHTVSYDAAHLNAHVFMSAHPGAAALSAVTATHSMQQGVAAQHSNQHPPQSHTPALHPSPSPVHQPPPNHSQPPTPTTMMYPGQMSQHPHHNPNQAMSAHVSHNYPGGPQPVVLMQQPPGSHSHHPGPHPLHLHSHSIHSQNHGSHLGGPAQVMPQMTVIPTSAAMVSAPNTMASSQFVPHPQGV